MKHVIMRLYLSSIEISAKLIKSFLYFSVHLFYNSLNGYHGINIITVSIIL